MRYTLTSWLPPGASPFDDVVRLNVHLFWSTLGGLAVGLIVLTRSTTARVAGVVLFLYIGLDHAAVNAYGNGPGVSNTWLAPVAPTLRFLWDWRTVMPMAALVLAWWLDRHRQHAAESSEAALAAEKAESFRAFGTLRAAASRLPGSRRDVYGFVRLRRAYQASRRMAPAESEALQSLVFQERDRFDRGVSPTDARILPRASWTPGALLAVLRQPGVIL